MKNTIAILFVLISLVACGKKDSSSTPNVLDSRLYGGTATWVDDYKVGAADYRETLVFFENTVSYKREFYASMQWNEEFSKVLTLSPRGTKVVTAVNAADATEVYKWTYTINGTYLRMCDEDDYCSTFDRQ